MWIREGHGGRLEGTEEGRDKGRSAICLDPEGRQQDTKEKDH